MSAFKIDFLDHVAIRVKDLEASANWYSNILGLKKYQFEEWGPFPIFMLSGKTGVALFPLKAIADNQMVENKKFVDHFAFNVDNENFNRAKKHYEASGIEYDFQDHHFFHSIYCKDPDGHTVELTTIVVDASTFYS